MNSHFLCWLSDRLHFSFVFLTRRQEHICFYRFELDIIENILVERKNSSKRWKLQSSVSIFHTQFAMCECQICHFNDKDIRVKVYCWRLVFWASSDICTRCGEIQNHAFDWFCSEQQIVVNGLLLNVIIFECVKSSEFELDWITHSSYSKLIKLKKMVKTDDAFQNELFWLELYRIKFHFNWLKGWNYGSSS